MIQAVGNGLSECYECKRKGLFSLTWTSFLYKTKIDKYNHLYCYNCCKEIEKNGGICNEQSIK